MPREKQLEAAESRGSWKAKACFATFAPCPVHRHGTERVPTPAGKIERACGLQMRALDDDSGKVQSWLLTRLRPGGRNLERI